jgi:predicted dehydrogenase
VRSNCGRRHIAVVGCGYWGAKHVRVLRQLPDVGDIIAVDGDLERCTNLVSSFPNVRAVTTIEDALDDVDAVVIATPATTHAKLALRAMEAGKHVLVEKPLTVYEEDAQMLMQAADEFGVVLMVGHTFEYNAAVRHMRHLIDAGEMGRLYYLDFARLNLGMYRSDVNVLWDLGPHDVSIANYLLRSEPTSVQAWGGRHAHHTVEDVAYVRLNYEDLDVTANVRVSWLDPCKVRKLTVVGSRRMAVYDDMAPEERIRVYDKGVDPSEANGHDIPMSYRYGGISSPYIDFEEPLLVQNRHFLQCIATGDTPLTDGRDGLAVVRTLVAADRALATGETVRLADTAPISRAC